MDAIKTIEKNGLVLKLFQDSDPMSPREWDNLGKMVCFHSRYELGDKHDFSDPEAVKAHIEKTEAIALPVYLMDHSGLSVSTSDYGCPWDSGQVGVIFVEKSRVLKEFSVKRITPKIRAKVLLGLKSEIETYNQYLTGDVYGYVIEKPAACHACGNVEAEHVDSCWGFFGHEYAETEALAALEAATTEGAK